MANPYGIYPRRQSMLGLGMPGNVQGKIDDGIRRSTGMPPKRYPLPGFPENPAIPAGHPPLQWSADQVGGIGALPVHNISNQQHGGQGFFNVPPEDTPSAPRFTNGPFGAPGPDMFGGHGVNQANQGSAAPPQPQSPLGQKPWWQRDLFTADDHLPQRTPTGAHFPSWPSTPVLDKSIFGIKAAMEQWIPQDAAKNLGRLGINVPAGMVKGGMPQTPSATPSQPSAPMLPPEGGGQSSVWGLPQARIPAPPPPRPANGAMTEDEANRYVDQTLGAQQRYQQAKERAVMANHRPEPAALPASDLQPTAPLYPAHPYSGKFPIQGRNTPSPVEVRDIGASNRAILGEIQAGNIPSNLIRPNMTPEQAMAAKAAWQNNKTQWAASNEKRAENATKEFEAQKLAYQRRRELAALAPRRRDMAESWIQSQFRQENPALFARGVNSDMLKYAAAMNARQRMDAPNIGGMSPQDSMLFRQKMYFDNMAGMTPEQRVEAQRMLGLTPPQQHATPAGVYPQQGQSQGGSWFHPLSPMGQAWKYFFGG